MTIDWKDIGKRISEFVKAGRIFVHSQQVRADRGETLLGDAPVYWASDGDLEALSLIHEPVGGPSFITKSVNTDYAGTVGTSARNYVRHPKTPCTFDEALKDKMGLTKEALYTKHNYGSFQEADPVLKEINRRKREIETEELPQAKVERDKNKAFALYKELADLETQAREREFEIGFGMMD